MTLLRWGLKTHPETQGRWFGIGFNLHWRTGHAVIYLGVWLLDLWWGELGR